MKSLAPLLLILLLGTGCATTAPQTRQVLKSPPPIAAESQIQNVHYVYQSEGDCGPAALSSVMSWAGLPVTLADLQSEVYTPSKKGSLPMDLVSASRRRGFMAVPIEGMSALLTEVAAGHPVIAFQNLGFKWLPRWHYHVVNGYDLKGQQIRLLAEKANDQSTPMTYFERHWSLAGYWGLVVLPAGQLSVTADEIVHARAAAGLEQIGKLNEARLAYQAILGRWPKSLAALIGLGNVAFTQADYPMAVRHLKRAVALFPDSTIAKNNLAVAEKKLRR